MPAVLVTGPTVMHDSLFVPIGDCSHSQYSLLPTHGGMALTESTWVLVLCQGGLPILRWSPVLALRGRAGHRITMLINSKPLSCVRLPVNAVLMNWWLYWCADREKKKEKDREDLWRRLESLQLNNQQLNNQQLSVQKIAT